MIVVLDNYDSFTHNLVHLVGGLGHETRVIRNDALSADEIIGLRPEAVVISPGPCTPNEAGVSVDLVLAAEKTTLPLFGVCLGMQSIAQAFGGAIVRAEKLMHGKTCGIVHQGEGMFENVPSPFTATRYHSLVASPSSLPNCLKVTAKADDDGEIMAVEHVAAPIAGVQFHPESIASEHGALIIENFLRSAA